MLTLITGANGMVARAAREYCESIGDEVHAFARAELDIADADAVRQTIERLRPDAILNCAAFTDVDGAEAQVEACYAANVEGVRNLARSAADFDARFVTISTDYVFSGEKEGLYTEDDLPEPKGVYAVSKFEGELAAAEANPEAVVVRSGWIYGRGGTNFLSVMHRLLGEGKAIKAISDSYGTPTYAGDLARRMRELAASDFTGVIHVTNAGEGTSYSGFAKKLAELGGFDASLIEDVSGETLKRPAPRPKSSKLGSVREVKSLGALPDWEDALKRFLATANVS
ncbi:MAG: dTDP-4-dehydrorhamnose reductase [Acidobacteria bacterium]|nr:dTDP-4-dehydrorhamnose reductase [Acidobacteriota bacterium]